PELFRAPSRFAGVRRTMEGMRSGDGPAVRQAAAVRAWLCAETGIAESKVGIIGFCFGGGFALAVGRGWGAISTNYGPVPASDAVLRGLGPTSCCYGARDVILGRNGALLESRVRSADV